MLLFLSTNHEDLTNKTGVQPWDVAGVPEFGVMATLKRNMFRKTRDIWGTLF